MSLRVEMKTTYGNDSVEIVRYCLKQDVPIHDIEDVSSQKEGVKKRIGYCVIALPKNEEQSDALQEFVDALTFNVKVKIKLASNAT